MLTMPAKILGCMITPISAFSRTASPPPTTCFVLFFLYILFMFSFLYFFLFFYFMSVSTLCYATLMFEHFFSVYIFLILYFISKICLITS